MVDATELKALLTAQGDKVKAIKAEKKIADGRELLEQPKDDPELVAAVVELQRLKKEFEEASKPVESNPYVGSQAELQDICKAELQDICKAELQDICKRRFFFRPAFDIYGGTAGFYTYGLPGAALKANITTLWRRDREHHRALAPRSYGPPGAALKANIIALWRRHFIIEENLMEIEDPTITDPTIMPHEVLKTSGHDPTIMPHEVLKTSGHVDRFNDFMWVSVLKTSGHVDRFNDFVVQDV
ncbi:hypothetical protein T484DRAFT_1848458 [Baffinella frigidus]|nr:hypothetical protein T484DRAFT_1848458 [Cryptophyta sp. CCMP2293]